MNGFIACSHHSAGLGKRLKSGIAGNREGSGGGDSVDSGYEEYEEDYRLLFNWYFDLI